MLSSIPVPLDTFLICNLQESSDPVGAARHDASGAAHQRAYRSRWPCAAGCCGGRTMRDLLGSHGFKYGTAACIARWKSLEMLIEVTFDLSLRLGDEPEAGTVAEQSGAGADEEGARVPQRIEEARPCGELPESHLAPRQVVRFGAGGRQEHRARCSWRPPAPNRTTWRGARCDSGSSPHGRASSIRCGTRAPSSSAPAPLCSATVPASGSSPRRSDRSKVTSMSISSDFQRAMHAAVPYLKP